MRMARIVTRTRIKVTQTPTARRAIQTGVLMLQRTQTQAERMMMTRVMRTASRRAATDAEHLQPKHDAPANC